MSDSERPIREVTRNRRAKYDFEILETLEVGVALHGTEVKTLRAGEVSLGEAFVRIRNGQMWLEQARIDECQDADMPKSSLVELLQEHRRAAERRQRVGRGGGGRPASLPHAAGGQGAH